MPYKHIEYLIPKKIGKDKRIKLTNSQKNEIYMLYNYYGAYSQRELAKMFGVSRRLITFVIEPNRLKKNYEQRLERGGSKIYYDKDKHTVAMRTHRNHKQELYLNNELIKKENNE